MKLQMVIATQNLIARLVTNHYIFHNFLVIYFHLIHLKWNIIDYKTWPKREGMVMEVDVRWPIININKTIKNGSDLG